MGRLIHREDGEEFVVMRRQARPVTQLFVFGVMVVALVVGCVTVSQGWYRRQIDPPGKAGPAVEVEVDDGTSVGGIATLLADKDVIANANVMRFWLRDKQVEVQAGVYEFRQDSSFQEALDTLEDGPAPEPTTPVTVPEGLTLPEIKDEIAKGLPRLTVEEVDAALRDASIRSKYQPADQASLEGLVFPSTYDVGETDDAASVVRRMVAETDGVSDRLDLAGGAERLGLTGYDVIKVASLVQEEAGNAEEMAMIARVIYNRLAAAMPLGIDATSRFLAEQTGTPIDLESTSPYNTRRNPGLPPTPIAGPGEPALRAALAPADGPWIYYVLEAPGRHFFTDSFDEFNAKKAECEAKGLGCG